MDGKSGDSGKEKSKIRGMRTREEKYIDGEERRGEEWRGETGRTVPELEEWRKRNTKGWEDDWIVLVTVSFLYFISVSRCLSFHVNSGLTS